MEHVGFAKSPSFVKIGVVLSMRFKYDEGNCKLIFQRYFVSAPLLGVMRAEELFGVVG